MEDVKVKSLYKAIKLLDYFSVDTPERGISELAELSGMYKSSVHNIATTLEKCGFLEKNEGSQKYRLGVKILQLNHTLYMTNDLRNTVRPYMEKISNHSQESVYFATPADLEVIYLDAVYPAGSFSAKSIIGIKAPLYCTGVGKALLAHLPQTDIDQVISRGLKSFTPNTFTDGDKLHLEMAETRERGYAIDNMEHEYGIKCVAVPIRNIRNEVIASISVSGPSLRFTDEKIQEYAALLLSVSRELKRHLQR
jgi:DNA-binding IclR family transcriptional regulator